MSDVDITTPPWWIGPVTDDYTRSRSAGATYAAQDLIGRRDYIKYKLVTSDPTTVSGIPGTVLI
jgi:hypothetical protein